MKRALFSLLAGAALAGPAIAQSDAFKTGPLIEGYGPVAAIPGSEPISETTEFRVSFDVTEAATPSEVSRKLETAARFLNMHAAAGVKPENMRLAIVLHSKAIRDVTNNAHYAEHNDGASNGNAKLIELLIANGVSFYVCGQSAAYYGVTAEDLLPGVTMSLSAMTRHAQLQQAGYTLNPF
ncbi:MAG: DsrE family protein [Pseudomonadota bacterium]